MHFILGTAGHIDHGKSSLIKALTGVNPDRLPEEQKRGVTIELGFAHLQIGGHEIGVVDVPGHADFVNNMVCGVSTLDLAIFVVAADDGWMPQSEEHLHILSYLGIKNIIIALTKIDTCEDVEFSIEMVREELQGSSLENCDILPVSSLTGEGIDALKDKIYEKAKLIKHDIKGRFPKLYVDRVFSPQGIGTVITGTLAGSELTVADQMLCYPLMLPTTVRHIQMHNSDSKTASPGSRVGINLSDLTKDQKGKKGISRGCTIAPVGMVLSKTLDVFLNRLERGIPGQQATKRPLKNTETVILHHGTARVKARVILIEGSQLNAGESRFAQLRLEEDICVCIGDHFIIRDGAQQGTLGGGIILNADAIAKKFRQESKQHLLQNRLDSIDTCRNLVLDELKTKGFISEQNPITNSPFSKSALRQAISKLNAEKKALSKGGFLFEKTWWLKTVTYASDIILNYHKEDPDSISMNLETFRATLNKQSIPRKLHPEIEDYLLRNGFSKKDSGIFHQDHNLELPERLQPLKAQIIKELDKAALNPPVLIDFIDSEEKQQVLQFLIKSEIITELSPKAILLTKHFTQAIDKVITFLESRELATSSDIRQELGVTRKVLIPLLELMDQKKITIRIEDNRKLLRY